MEKPKNFVTKNYKKQANPVSVGYRNLVNQ